MKDLKKLKCYTRLRKRKQFVSWTIFFLFAISFSSSVDAQQLTREQVMDTIYTMPAFSMYQDNYMISGIPLHRDIGSETADVKYQISFKHLLTRTVLPLDSYLFLTYTQTAFWNLYTFSSPFEDINFNPGVGLGKAVFDSDDRLVGMAFFKAEHESNGRDSIYSRSWNSISLNFRAHLTENTTISLKGWFPFIYKDDNPDLLDYIGLGEFNLYYHVKPKKLSLEVMLRKGLNWDWKGALRTRIAYRPFNMRNQYLMLEWFHGYGETLISYNQMRSMIRVGFVFKSDEFNFLKPPPQRF